MKNWIEVYYSYTCGWSAIFHGTNDLGDRVVFQVTPMVCGDDLRKACEYAKYWMRFEEIDCPIEVNRRSYHDVQAYRREA